VFLTLVGGLFMVWYTFWKKATTKWCDDVNKHAIRFQL
jgi:hypothetical protein